MQSFDQILPRLLLDLRADSAFINFHDLSLRVRVVQNTDRVERKSYVFDGYNQALSDFKKTTVFLPNFCFC